MTMYRVAQVLSTFDGEKQFEKQQQRITEATRFGWGKTLTGSSRFKLPHFYFVIPREELEEVSHSSSYLLRRD